MKKTRLIGLFPQRRQLLEPINFTHQPSDAAALNSDFARVGKDLRAAMERHEKEHLPQH